MPNRYGLAIRAANAGDAEGIGALLRAAGLAVDHRGLALRLDEIPALAGLVLLAEDWGPPGGVLALRWSWTLFEAQKVAEVTALVVDPEQRRKGIAALAEGGGAGRAFGGVWGASAARAGGRGGPGAVLCGDRLRPFRRDLHPAAPQARGCGQSGLRSHPSLR